MSLIENMSHIMEDTLSELQLKKLSLHQYKAEGRSLVEPPMQKFWQWLVQQIPLWWAPNAITLAGLIVNVVSTTILIYYCPDATREVSNICLRYSCQCVIVFISK